MLLSNNMLPVFKPVLTSKIFWQLSHDDGFGVMELCIIPLRKHIPKKPLDSTVLPVNNYLSKVRKKKTTTKAFVQHFNHFKQIIFGWKIIFRIMPFLAPQRTLWITSVVGCKGEGGGGGECHQLKCACLEAMQDGVSESGRDVVWESGMQLVRFQSLL